MGNTIGQANAVSDKVLDLRECVVAGKNLKGLTLSGALLVGADLCASLKFCPVEFQDKRAPEVTAAPDPDGSHRRFCGRDDAVAMGSSCAMLLDCLAPSQHVVVRFCRAAWLPQ